MRLHRFYTRVTFDHWRRTQLGKRQKVSEEHYSSSREAVTVIFRLGVVGKPIRRWTKHVSSSINFSGIIEFPMEIDYLKNVFSFSFERALIFQSD